MEVSRGNLTAVTEPGRMEICNGRIRVSLYLMDGGYVQEFYAADRKGRFHLLLSSVHRNLIVSSEHRTCSSPMIAGDRAHLFAITRDSLRMPYSEVRVAHHDETRITAELSGSALGHSLKCSISLDEGSNRAHVTVEDEIDRAWADPLVEYAMASYAFLPDGKPLAVGESLDYVWVPSLRPAGDHVIGDCCLHAPAAIVQIGSFAAALVPDLELLGRHRPMPTCLDLDLKNGLLPAPLLSYGFCGYEQVYDANYCRHDVSQSRRLGGSRLTFGCHLIFDADCPRDSAYRQVSRFLWDMYGSASSRRGLGGGPEPRPGRQPLPSIQAPDAWAACGLHAAGIRGDDEQLIYQARALKNAVLSAPQNDGIFPTRYDLKNDEWAGCHADVAGATYNTVECSVQLYWLLEWHKRVEPDPRIIERAEAYAGFLMNARQRGGAIPAWYGADRIPLSPARSGTQTAASALFLAQLADVTGEPKYAQAAELSARFVLRSLAPKRIYEDHLLLDPVNRLTLECPDPHTGARPASGGAMLWIAFLFAELHRLLSRPEAKRPVPLDYLKTGLAILDELCLLQSVWSKPWAPQHLERGLCARGNVGTRYDAELTAEFARCAMRYGAITGDRDYFERGAAALSAVQREPGLSAITQARVAAATAAVEAEYGSIYVHLGRKWAVPLNGWRVARVEVGPTLVAIRVEPGSATGPGRIVFGGARARSHRVRINGQVARYSRRELESGIPVTGGHPAHAQPVQLRLIPY